MVELKDKLSDVVVAGVTTFAATVSDETPDAMSTLYEAREALVGLGMSIAQAESALATTDDGASAEDRVRQALKNTKKVRA